jgi:hypothetical protein
MKHTGRKIFSTLIIVIFILGLLPITAYAASPSDIVIGNSYTLESGKTLYDDLFILGGNVNLMSGSTVNGNVVLVGGSLLAAGTVYGEITVLGGTMKLASTFVLNGNLSTSGTSINRDPGAQINGQIHTNEYSPNFILPGGIRFSNQTDNVNLFFNVAGFFLRLLLWALIAMVVAMFIPSHLSRTSQTALSSPLISGGLGLLTVIVVPIVVVLLAITICLIPVALIVAFLLVIAWAFGLITLGIEVGKRIAALSHQEWHPAITAGLGTLLLMIVLNGLQAIVPCVGWIPKTVMSFIGLGAVLLTQFGTKPYVNNPSPPGDDSATALPA